MALEMESVKSNDFWKQGGKPERLYIALFHCKFKMKNYFLDTRVANWPLMESPIPLMCLLATYFMIIYRWGPA